MKAVNKFLFLLCTLLIFGVGSAWGKTLTAKVAVGSGEGNAVVEVYSKWWGISPVKSTSTTGSQKSVSYDEVSIVNWAYSKYTATANDGYKFDAWYTNSSCSSGKKTSNPYTTGNATGNRTDEFWAKFIPVTVNSVTTSTSSLTFSEPGKQTITLTFNVSNADEEADFNTPTISNSEWNIDSWSYADNKVTVVVSLTVTNSTVKGSDHNATITLTSKGTSDNQSKSATVGATVDMNPKFTCNINSTYLVDDAVINLASLWTSTSNGTITYTIESFVASGVNNEGATQPKIVNKMLSLGQAGTVVLKLTQAASVSYNAGSMTKTITINKRDNLITIAGFDDNDHKEHYIKTDWYDNEITLTANNTNYSARPINYERTQGNDTQASFGPQEGAPGYYVVYTSQNKGVVSWRVWQEEDYKYKAAENTFAVNVISAPCGCALREQSWSGPWTKTVSEVGRWDFGGIGDTLTFELRSKFAAGNHMTYTLITDGKEEKPVRLKAESELYFAPVEPIALSIDEHNTTSVIFAKSSVTGIGTDDPYLNNIKVTRKRWMKILRDSKTEISSLPKMERIVDADTAYATFYVDFSTCDSLVKIASDDAHVTFGGKTNRDTISENTSSNTKKGYNEMVEVIVRYYSAVPEEKTVTITIYTEYENKTITVPVKTIGYIFEGKTDDDWTKASNWNVNKVPTEVNDVTIEAAALIQTQETVHSMKITTGSITIAPQGGLTIGAGGITGATEDNLILKAGTEGKIKGETGYLRISPEYTGAMPEATVELFSLGYYNMNSEEENVAAWQYVGIPVESSALAKTFFKSNWIYSWIEADGEWQNNRSKLVMNPFEGYATTQYKSSEGLLVTFAGNITAGRVHVAPVTANGETEEQGCNVLANSFTAPIDITKFDTKDFSDGVEATIYLFNTGSRKDATAKRSVDDEDDAISAPGQYIAIPVANVEPLKAAYKELPTVIASMQGFCVKTTKAGTVTLNYERLVWEGNYKDHPNTPLHMPRKAINTSTLGSLCIAVSANGWSDKLYMLESESYDKSYEMGYDALKMASGELNIFAVEEDKQLAVDATNNMVGTYIGVRTSAETTYSLTFSHVISEHDLLLFDSETNEVLDIVDGLDYTFTAEPNAIITDRFQILEREKAPEVTTAIEKAEASSVKVKKFIKDNQLYILKNGVLYNATGARVH